jgi:hypothetical protein
LHSFSACFAKPRAESLGQRFKAAKIISMKKSDINPLPEYFERYINQVVETDLDPAFKQSVRSLEMLDASLLAKLDGKKYAPDKFTVKDIFQHLIDWERIFCFRALLFARGEGTASQAIDENLLAAKMNANRRTIAELIDELKIVRLSSGAMFAGFDDEMLMRSGMNWKYEMSVLAMGFTILGHQKHHLKIIEEKYLPLV